MLINQSTIKLMHTFNYSWGSSTFSWRRILNTCNILHNTGQDFGWQQVDWNTFIVIFCIKKIQSRYLIQLGGARDRTLPRCIVENQLLKIWRDMYEYFGDVEQKAPAALHCTSWNQHISLKNTRTITHICQRLLIWITSNTVFFVWLNYSKVLASSSLQ